MNKSITWSICFCITNFSKFAFVSSFPNEKSESFRGSFTFKINVPTSTVSYKPVPSSSSVMISPTSILLIYLTTDRLYLTPFHVICMWFLRRPSATYLNDEPPTLDMRCNQSCPGKHLWTHLARTLIYYLCEEHKIKNSQDLFSKVVMSGISYTLNFHQITANTIKCIATLMIDYVRA